MEIIFNKIFLLHQTGDHPESKKRLEVFKDLKEREIENGEKFLILVHTKEYIKFIKSLSLKEKSLDLDTPLSKESYKVACFAVGASILASKENNFALIRPPGHHAGSNFGGGFCLFNNIAIASKRIVKEGKRVFILDFDGHFGDGTSQIFYNSKNVLYCSIHQYPAYPGKGKMKEVGEGEGEGFNINFPLPPQSGDDIFLKAAKILISIGRQFSPDVVGVSAGFDGHKSDPLLNLNFSATSFYKIGKMLSENFSKIFAVLEGGYNLEYLPKCVYNFIAGINKEEIPFKEKETKTPKIIKNEFDLRKREFQKTISKYWKIQNLF